MVDLLVNLFENDKGRWSHFFLQFEPVVNGREIAYFSPLNIWCQTMIPPSLYIQSKQVEAVIGCFRLEQVVSNLLVIRNSIISLLDLDKRR
jgi:hypothetical protein